MEVSYDGIAAAGYSLQESVENLLYLGKAGITAQGNASDNYISTGTGDDSLLGEVGNDTLVGGSGRNTLAGGTGDDIYRMVNSLDVLVENADAGRDRVESPVSFRLGANFEDLTLTLNASFRAASVNGHGNGLNNRILGNYAANVLDGLGGDDTLDGDAGDDTLLRADRQ